jgi:hypothetical protein
VPERLDVSRHVCRISQCHPQLADYGAKALVEVNERVIPPEFLDDLGARDDLTRALEQKRQDSKWLCLQPDADASFAQFSRLKIGFEYPEANDRSSGVVLHDETPAAGSLLQPRPARRRHADHPRRQIICTSVT